ncbi:MAG TPA: putative glycoside hydrolase [Candidatus Paceibacterota bacterium]
MRQKILRWLGILFFIGLITAGVFLFSQERQVDILPVNGESAGLPPARGFFDNLAERYESLASAQKEPERPTGVVPVENSTSSTPRQKPLTNPAVVIKGLYLTGLTAGSSRLKQIISFARARGLNGVVIDVKDYSGYLTYKTDLPEVAATGAEKELRVADINSVIKQLHDNNLYAIARITVFQDPILAKAHPEWALRDKANGGLWRDRKGLSWLDPAAEGVRAYHVALAKDALNHGFDEVNFDYIRFPSDGVLTNIKYPFWDEKTPRREVMRGFFKYLRENMPGAKISADLFGLTTYASDDLGIGQTIEDAYPYFDFICPMVYPSHYSPGILGFKNPAEHPYEVIKYSLEAAFTRFKNQTAFSSSASTTTPASLPQMGKLRPWLQVFDLGAVYDREMINKQIAATEEVLNSAESGAYGGWLLWDPKNIYKNFQP